MAIVHIRSFSLKLANPQDSRVGMRPCGALMTTYIHVTLHCKRVIKAGFYVRRAPFGRLPGLLAALS